MSDSEAYKVAETSLHADDWPGVLARLSADWRLSVDRDRKRYHAQFRVAGVGQPDEWAALPKHKARTGSELLAKCPDVPGLAEALDGLPERAADLQGQFAEAASKVGALYDATDWRREDYLRVIIRDGNMRLVVDPSGDMYRLQWVPTAYARDKRDEWRTLRACPDLAPVRKVMDHVRYIDDFEEIAAPDLRAALETLPERACDGLWPAMPKRPASVSRTV